MSPAESSSSLPRPWLSQDLPSWIEDEKQLEDQLSSPTDRAMRVMGELGGDVIVLGAGGKMGPTIARMVRRALDRAGRPWRVLAVSRFSDPAVEAKLKAWGIETLRGDLLDPSFLDRVPDAPNVLSMLGMKFGTTGQEPLTWAQNTFLPGMVARRFRGSRIVAFSTGNVYGLVPVVSGGSHEADPLAPVGEYSISALGRERIYDYVSRVEGTPAVLLRLNYACELRYGVLVDLALKVWRGEPIDLAMSCFNTLWQGDANARALEAFALVSSPARVLNITGPETLSVKRVAQEFGLRMGREPVLRGEEHGDALLSNSTECQRIFGYPRVPPGRLMDWVADWIERGGILWNKPTHFEARDGAF